MNFLFCSSDFAIGEAFASLKWCIEVILCTDYSENQNLQYSPSYFENFICLLAAAAGNQQNIACLSIYNLFWGKVHFYFSYVKSYPTPQGPPFLYPTFAQGPNKNSLFHWPEILYSIGIDQLPPTTLPATPSGPPSHPTSHPTRPATLTACLHAQPAHSPNLPTL